jgi:biotin synthase
VEQSRQAIYDIVDKGLEGNGLSDGDIRTLYATDPETPEAFYLMWAGRQLQRQSSNNIAEVHAQIGLNGSPCPKNCQFCSFAVCNKVRQGRLEMSKEEVVEYVQIYEEQGANALLMMVTATYRFEKLLEMGQAVREVISRDMPLLANTGDMSLEQAQQLKAAGFNGCYHAVRMGEGVTTTIPVKTRLETFKNIRAAGLSLSTCVEPVGPEHTPEELTEKTRICIESGALSAGVGKRIMIPGTLLAKYGQLNNLIAGRNIAVYRLAAGLQPRLNCAGGTDLASAMGANLAWAEVGTNPRDTEKRTEKGGRGVSIEFCKKVFRDAGWDVLQGPSPGWMLTQENAA